ncbi:acyl-CoA thioester hydrolase, YbgC/YbaW family [Leptospira yanagawae serovar Saopaulo str. Sao Paulo = ATCC 700523]|uniref:Acyl-CoA thioester hydrolase, YbgC/YbaW family n=1 Tax=Leptospira yanagawae serovar Saopaulo str. Sao Paulo = ATCC 700523 TaxID=1249483 RepID=A0A5E8HEX9_9LEPT|nr:thioesterase family protein [Leptospira yanagawae]EOQ89462.1 acyl-CoA thioester hydrolase, YbgC/YbaW family [Leptospira yanagawae serovar Saopaulo str. Sao Paulo = ATCC 700523]
MKQNQFVYQLRIRYSEVDTQGIVFNANYLNYLDVAITEYFRAKGISYTEFMEKYQLDFHVIQSLIDYRNGAKFDEVMEVQLEPSYQSSKVFWEFQMKIGEKRICSGILTYITVSHVTKKIVSIPEEVIQLLQWKKKEQ